VYEGKSPELKLRVCGFGVRNDNSALQVALGDRPISITVARTWHALTFWEKAKLLASLIWTGLAPSSPERLKTEIERMKASFGSELGALSCHAGLHEPAALLHAAWSFLNFLHLCGWHVGCPACALTGQLWALHCVGEPTQCTES
jgi:hypothetical protein